MPTTQHLQALPARSQLRQYTEMLERLQGYAEKDPDFEQAIVAFADAEVAAEDPVEGSADFEQRLR